MKRSLILSGLMLAFACGLYAQAAAPADVNVCDVVKNPANYNGKMVRIKGTVVMGFDEFAIKDATDPNCGFQVNAIWLSYPQGTKAKSGPAAVVTVQPAHNFAGTYKVPERTAVTLERDKAFKQFDSLLSQTHQKGDDMCLGCARYTVTATLTGRLDTVADATLQRDKSGKIVGFGGFGNMNAYPARLVLQSVSDVTPKEIDYSKTDALTKGTAPTGPPQATGPQFDDPFATADKLASHMSGSAAAEEAQKAIGAFPKAKEQNGVNVIWGEGNDVTSEQEGTKDSPDGVLYNCTINRDRMQGKSLVVALFHVGEHVYNLRSPKAGNEDAPLIFNEDNAWMVTSMAAIVGGQKYLTLPGGYLLWSSDWPADERNDKMETAMKNFLSQEAGLSQ